MLSGIQSFYNHLQPQSVNFLYYTNFFITYLRHIITTTRKSNIHKIVFIVSFLYFLILIIKIF